MFLRWLVYVNKKSRLNDSDGRRVTAEWRVNVHSHHRPECMLDAAPSAFPQAGLFIHSLQNKPPYTTSMHLSWFYIFNITKTWIRKIRYIETSIFHKKKKWLVSYWAETIGGLLHGNRVNYFQSEYVKVQRSCLSSPLNMEFP